MNEDLWQNRYVDDTSNSLIGIDVEHREIHKGRMFMNSQKQTLAAAGVYNIGILTGAKGIHYKPSAIVTTADSLMVYLCEEATLTGGTTATAVNLNRNSENTTNAVIKLAPTVTNDGTIIGQSFLGGSAGIGQTRSGGTASGVFEIVLKPNTQYLLKVVNGSTESNTFQITFGWYEPL